ncbi:hypothetical protein LCGC14_0385400 [marine sediment metagenome]|uniref:2-dehydropantoate 2-reductase n=1 Tax=marine sediment metagenome TaxID=412755 RepID=A0A0F9T6V0_9ZZZZ|nr:MAG: 2-dehydropantoate 2-reductase [Candidatus Lokiarchaeum sp. GC14_75]
MKRNHIRIGYIGAGSIGSLFGGYIANVQSEETEIETIFFCTKEHAEKINQSGLKIIKNQEVKETRNIRAYPDEKVLEDKIRKEPSFGFDFMFLTTKAYDLEKAIKQYKNLIEVSKWLVILQNGIGNEDIAGKYILKSKLIRAVTTNGAFLKEPGKILHTGDGITKIGFPFLKNSKVKKEDFENAYKDLENLKGILESASFETEIVDDVIKESWEKVFVNVGINAFGALTRLPNGVLLDFDEMKSLMGEAINEATNIAKVMNIEILDKDYVAYTLQIAKKTSQNKNSMLQDILNGKQTEIDFINGRVIKYAQDLGMKVPINTLLTYLIKGLERSFN